MAGDGHLQRWFFDDEDLMIFEFFPVFRVHFAVHAHATHRVAAVTAQRAAEVPRGLMHFEMVAHLRLGDADKVAKEAAQQRTMDDVVRKRGRVTGVNFQQTRRGVRRAAD